MPFFGLGESGFLTAVAQGIAVAALLSSFGTLLFLALNAPPVVAWLTPPERASVARRWRYLATASLISAVGASALWFVAESASMAAADTLGAAFAAIAPVFFDTEFGRLLGLQTALLAAAAAVLGRAIQGPRLWVAMLLATVAAVLQAWHLHGAAMYRGLSFLLISEVFHVLATGAWLGSLLPLFLLIRGAPPRVAAMACERYSRLGVTCVVTLIVTGAWQGWVLVGSMRGLFATAFGWMVLVKLALFATLIAFAWQNRFRLTPRLREDEAEWTHVRLGRSILQETLVALVVVLAAALLSSLPPAMDMTVSARTGYVHGTAYAASQPVPCLSGRRSPVVRLISI